MFKDIKKTLLTASPERNMLLKKWISIGTLFGMGFSALVWFSPIADRWHATELEVVEITATSMEKHMVQQASVPYAMKNDITHQGNIRIDEKIFGAKSEIIEIEDNIDLGQLTPTETAIENRKIQRLKEKIEVWKTRYEPEPGALHTHGN